MFGKNAEKLVRESYELLFIQGPLSRDKIKKAIECAKKALDKEPERYDAQWLLASGMFASAYVDKERLDYALVEFDKAIEKNPNGIQAWFFRYYFLEAKRTNEMKKKIQFSYSTELLKSCEKIIEIFDDTLTGPGLDPSDRISEEFDIVDVWYTRVGILGELNKLDEENECFENMIQLQTSAENLGMIFGYWSSRLNHLKKYHEAKEICEQGLLAVPYHELIMRELQIAERELGKS